MAIVACWKVLNEADYLDYSIHSVVEYVDKLIITEGTEDTMRRWIRPDRIDPRGFSSDGTHDIILKWQAELGEKLVYIPAGFTQSATSDLENILVHHCEVGDWYWAIDGDEVYHQEDVESLTDIMRNNDDVWTIELEMFNYWHDFKHRIRGGRWDGMFIRPLRLVEPGMTLKSATHLIQFKDGRLLETESRNQEKHLKTDIKLHHFHYVQTPQAILEKQLWQGEKQNHWSTAPDWEIYRRTFKHPANFIIRRFCWFSNIYDRRHDVKVERHEEPLPEVMENHPFIEWEWDEQEYQMFDWRNLVKADDWQEAIVEGMKLQEGKTLITECPLCEDAKEKAILMEGSIDAFVEKRNPEKDPTETWQVVQCSNCKLIFYPEPPTNPDEAFYDKDYFIAPIDKTIGYPNYIEQQHLLAKVNWGKEILDWLNEKTGSDEPKSILEVGCAVGAMLIPFQQAGWRVVGQEVSQWAKEYGENEFGLDIRLGRLYNLDFSADEPFDCVLMWDSFEHEPQPHEFLARLQEITTPEMIGIIHMPDAAFAKENQEWHYWAPGQHNFIYSKDTLDTMLKKHGFQIVGERLSPEPDEMLLFFAKKKK